MGFRNWQSMGQIAEYVRAFSCSRKLPSALQQNEQGFGRLARIMNTQIVRVVSNFVDPPLVEVVRMVPERGVVGTFKECRRDWAAVPLSRIIKKFRDFMTQGFDPILKAERRFERGRDQSQHTIRCPGRCRNCQVRFSVREMMIERTFGCLCGCQQLCQPNTMIT